MRKTANRPARLRRAESFLGVHFDFHAGKNCTAVGRGVTRGMIERIIEAVQPDYLQCDCKGHPGLSSYPTKVGNPAPGFVGDPLRVWREATAKHGVALYMHYSGVWDSEALRQHPSWARLDAKGRRDKNNTSVFGPYVERLLIPQMKELCDDYDVDGVWVDGDCWATAVDYERRALALFRERTGIQTVPRRPEDPYYHEFLEFCRDGFRRYLEHYVTAMHRHKPDFQVASNWAYSSRMPEPPSVPVDFISGDYSPLDSVNSARFEARCIAPQGKPWDLMAWSFAFKWGDQCQSTKTVPQLQQEAAVVLAMGGGFQAYFTQGTDGTVAEWQMTLMAPVARFCRARQAFCHRARAVPQIALLNSTTAYYRHNPGLFVPGAQMLPLKGILFSLLDHQEAVEVLSEHHLAGRMHEYPLIIVPESGDLAPAFQAELLDYVRAGGNLLLVGPAAAAPFAAALQVRLEGEATDKMQWLEHNGWLAGLKTVSQSVRLTAGATACGRLFPQNRPEGKAAVAASVATCGRGRIAATYLNLGERYLNARNSVARDWLGALVRELFPEPLATVRGSHTVDVCVNRSAAGRLAVNLVSTAGPHSTAHVFDDIPPVGPLTVSLRLPKPPRRLCLEPDDSELTWHEHAGRYEATIERLHIHVALMVDEG